MAPPPPPARIQVNPGPSTVRDTGGSSFTIRNVGGQSTSWSIGGVSTGGLGGTLHFSHGSGTLNPGQSIGVSVSWTGGKEGSATGGFTVYANGGSTSVSVGLDSNYRDTVYSVTCIGASKCQANTDLLIQMVIGTQPGFNYEMPYYACFKVLNGSNSATQCNAYQFTKYYTNPVLTARGYVVRFKVPVRWTVPFPGMQISVWTADSSRNQLGNPQTVTVH